MSLKSRTKTISLTTSKAIRTWNKTKGEGRRSEQQLRMNKRSEV